MLSDTFAAQKAQRMAFRAMRDSTDVNEPELVNPRVWKMFKEAIEFKAHTVTPFQHELALLESSTISLFDGVLPLLRAPLPRVWEMVDGGLAEPIRPTVSHNHPNIAGGKWDETAMRVAVQEFEARLQLKVRRPLRQWEEALETVRSRFPELERLKAKLENSASKVARQERKAEKEARTRQGIKRGAAGSRLKGGAAGVSRPRTPAGAGGGVGGLLYRCTHPLADEDRERGVYVGGEGVGGGLSTGAEATGGDIVDDEVVYHEFKREERDMKLKERMRKVEAAREAFQAEETLLYEQLSGLCRDAAWTKSYVASALLMTKELFQEQVFNLGDTMQPLPACKSLPNARPAGTPVPREGVELEDAYVAGGVEVPAAVSGQLGSNWIYMMMMPEFATRARARATLEDLRQVAGRRAHAHKATAAPLELHAHPDARPSERVYPARRGAAEVPLSAVPQQALTPRSSVAGTPVAGAAGGAFTPAGNAYTPVKPVTPGREAISHPF